MSELLVTQSVPSRPVPSVLPIVAVNIPRLQTIRLTDFFGRTVGDANSLLIIFENAGAEEIILL